MSKSAEEFWNEWRAEQMSVSFRSDVLPSRPNIYVKQFAEAYHQHRVEEVNKSILNHDRLGRLKEKP